MNTEEDYMQANIDAIMTNAAALRVRVEESTKLSQVTIAKAAETDRLVDENRALRQKVSDLEAMVEQQTDVHASLAADLEARPRNSQIPDGMQKCTILLKNCGIGHSWLTATNWVEHGCPTCALQASAAEAEALRGDLELVRKQLFDMAVERDGLKAQCDEAECESDARLNEINALVVEYEAKLTAATVTGEDYVTRVELVEALRNAAERVGGSPSYALHAITDELVRT